MSTSLKSAVFSIASGKVAFILIGFIFTPILVRLLGPELYGRYAVVLSTFAFANFILTSGTNDAVRKYISERDDPAWQEAVFGTLLRVALGLAALIALAFILGASTGAVERIFGREYIILFYLLAFHAIGRQAYEFPIRAVMGLQLERYSEPVKVLRRLLASTLALFAAYLGYGVAGILVGEIITSFVFAFILVGILNHYFDIRSAISASAEIVPKIQVYSYTLSTIVFFGLLMSLYHVDILILQTFEVEETVGYYRGALTIAETVWFVPTALQMALLQRVSHLWREGGLNEIQQHATVTTRFSVAFTLLVIMGIAALSEDFVTLYLGADFQPAILPLLLLLPGVLGFAAARPTIAINQARQSLRPLIAATGGCALVNFAFNLLLIPSYGMIGAAIATSIGYGSLVVFQSIIARMMGYSPLHDLRILPIGASGIIAGIPIFGLASALPSLLALAVVPPLGFIVYLVTSISMGVFTVDEFSPLIENLPERASEPALRAINRIPKFYSE